MISLVHNQCIDYISRVSILTFVKPWQELDDAERTTLPDANIPDNAPMKSSALYAETKRTVALLQGLTIFHLRLLSY